MVFQYSLHDVQFSNQNNEGVPRKTNYEIDDPFIWNNSILLNEAFIESDNLNKSKWGYNGDFFIQDAKRADDVTQTHTHSYTSWSFNVFKTV